MPEARSPEASTLPLDTLRDELPSLGDGPFVVYCEVGQRGHTATSLLHELGFEGSQSRWWLPHLARC